jgi:hypothetical protein
MKLIKLFKMRKKITIRTSLPKNLGTNTKYIFKRRENYRIPILKTKMIKNVFLTHYGIIMKNLLPIKYTLPNAFGYKMPNAGFFYEFYKKALEIYLVCRFGKSLSSIKLDENKTYLFIYSPWLGYFSWVTESLPRIISVLDRHKKLTLIVPESYLKKKFISESIKMFPELQHEVIPDGIHMRIPKLVIPELKPYTYFFDPITMKNYRKWVWNYIDTIDFQIETYDNIYVSRKKAKNRKLFNEKEVLTIFNKYDYKEICFEDYTFFEQVFLMKNCKVLAGVHGAGFANISFMPKDSILFEMIKEYSSYKEERPSYWRLCSSINVDYYIQYCKPVKYGNYDLWIGVDLICNTLELQTNLNLIEDNKGKYNIL